MFCLHTHALKVRCEQNPDRPSNANIGLKNKADYPEDLKKEFEDYSFIAVKTPKVSLCFVARMKQSLLI